MSITSVVVTGLALYALGARGDALFWLVLLTWLPIQVVVQTITLRLFPPDAELTGEFRGILYGKSEASPGPKGGVAGLDSKDRSL